MFIAKICLRIFLQMPKSLLRMCRYRRYPINFIFLMTSGAFQSAPICLSCHSLASPSISFLILLGTLPLLVRSFICHFLSFLFFNFFLSRRPSSRSFLRKEKVNYLKTAHLTLPLSLFLTLALLFGLA